MSRYLVGRWSKLQVITIREEDVSSLDGKCVDGKLRDDPLGLYCFQLPRIPTIKRTLNTFNSDSLPKYTIQKPNIKFNLG